MRLLSETIDDQLPRMFRHQIRLRFIGDRSQLSQDLQAKMQDAERQTAHFSNMSLVIAVSYGGKWDIAEACRHLAKQVASGVLKPDDIDEHKLSEYISLADEPTVDMLIRTGGDYRISNFLLWQCAYAELFFTETLFPDFSPIELDKMIAIFTRRERRFGKTSEQILGLK